MIGSDDLKKIIIVNDFLYGGGVEKVLMTLIGNLDLEKYEITLLNICKGKDPYKYFDKRIKYSYLNFTKTNNVICDFIKNRYIKIKTYLLMKKKYDIAIAFKEGHSMQIVDNIKADKKFAWIHVDYIRCHWTTLLFKDGQELECMKRFDKIICVSKSVKDSVIESVGDSNNLSVIYNPIDEKEILDKSNELVTDVEKPKDKVLLVTVGRLDRQKGYDRLLRICNSLKDRFEFELWIIGEGRDENSLRQYIEINKVQNVKLLGLKENPYKYMKLADWFICSSLFEGYSTVLQEATLLEVPIITTECAGSKELLGDSEYGLVVDNTEEELYKGVIRILSDEKLADYYKDKIKVIKNNISLNDRINEIVTLFE